MNNPDVQFFRRKTFLCLVCVILVTAPSANSQYQWTCRYPNLGYAPYDGRAWEGYHSVKYVSHIPVSNLTIPSPCISGLVSTTSTTYKGDPGAIIYGYPPQSWRTSSFFGFVLTTGQQGPFWKDPGETRNYGFGSPANGFTLSSLDEDGIANDCVLWNQSAYASNAGWYYENTTPSLTQGQVRFAGEGGNPLELFSGSITWDMRTQVDISNLDSIKARVSYNHTAYPAHAISVNNYIVYSYYPPSNDPVFIFNSLVLRLNKVNGSQSFDTQVPCN